MRIVFVALTIAWFAGCMGGCGPLPGEVTWQQQGLYDAARDHPEATLQAPQGPRWDVAEVDVEVALVQASLGIPSRGHEAHHSLRADPSGQTWSMHRVHDARVTQDELRTTLEAFLEALGQKDHDVEHWLAALAANRTQVATEYGGADDNGTAIYNSEAVVPIDVPALRAATGDARALPSSEMPLPGTLAGEAGALDLRLSLATATVPVAVDDREEPLVVDALDRAALSGVPPDSDETAWIEARLRDTGLPDAGVTRVQGQYAIC